MVGEPVASEPTQPILVVWYHALDRYNQDTGIDLHNALPGQQDLNTKAMISSFLNLRPSQKPLVPALEPILDDIDWLLSMANNGEVKRVSIRIIHIVDGVLCDCLKNTYTRCLFRSVAGFALVRCVLN